MGGAGEFGFACGGLSGVGGLFEFGGNVDCGVACGRLFVFLRSESRTGVFLLNEIDFVALAVDDAIFEIGERLVGYEVELGVERTFPTAVDRVEPTFSQICLDIGMYIEGEALYVEV